MQGLYVHHLPWKSFTLSTAQLENWSKSSQSRCSYFITTPGIVDIKIQLEIRDFWNIVAGQSLCRTGRSSRMLSDWLLYTAAAVAGDKNPSLNKRHTIVIILLQNERKCTFQILQGNIKALIFLTSWTEKDPLVDDIITLHFLLSIAKVSKARHSCWKKRFKKHNILQKAKQHWYPGNVFIQYIEFDGEIPTWSFKSLDNLII